MRSGRDFTIYVFLTIAAALLLLLVSLVGPGGSDLPSNERYIVALAFIACCIFGMVVSLRPRCHRFGKGARKSDLSRSNPSQGRRLIGHHPDCGSFDGHVIAIRGRRYCGGCLGLALGSLAAAIIMVVLIFIDWAPQSIGLPLLIAGLGLVALALAETAHHLGPGAIHVLMNAALVIGFLLTVVGVTTATQSGGYGLIAIVLCLLWMDTRVQISDWKHARVCDDCPQGCKSY